MTRILFPVFFLLFSNAIFAQQKIVKIDAQTTDLEGLIQVLENDFGWLVSYKEDDIINVKITPPKGEFPIAIFLEKTLKNTSLRHEIVDDKYIILSQKEAGEIPEKLDDLCGTIYDKNTGEALSFATILLKNKSIGTNTDEQGKFELQAKLMANDSLMISYVGYEKKTYSAHYFTEQPCRKIALNYAEYSDAIIIVKEYLTDGISLSENGAATHMQPAKIGSLPGQIEPDVLDAIQFLPGITSPDGSAANICIRGGTPDQNLILWEDIPLYHTAHYFGMISALNPYIMDDVAVYRGDFSAEYGGRVSGLIDLKSNSQKAEQPNVIAGINFLNAYVNAKTPLLNNKASLLVSARHSIADVWRSPTYESITKRIHQGVLLQIPTSNKIPPHISISDDFRFFDTNAKFTYKITSKDQVSLAGFYGKNNFDDVIFDGIANKEQTDTLALENSGFSAAWTHQWSPRFSSKLTVLRSDYHYDYDYIIDNIALNRPDRLGTKKNRINEQQIHLLNTFRSTKKMAVKLGYQLTDYRINYQINRADGDQVRANENHNHQSNLHVLYTTINSPKNKRIAWEGGLRYSYFQKTKQAYVEPRMRVSSRFSDAFRGYVSAGKYYQFLSRLVELEGDQLGIQTPVWVLAGEEETPVLEASQLLFGTVYQHKKWLIDVQAYVKKTKGITSLATGFSEDVGRGYHIGESPVRGIDILVKKRWKNYRTWVSYSWSKADYLFPTFFDKNFPSPNDQRHLFNWSNTWSYGNFKCALGWELRSGLAYSNLENYRILPEENPPNPPLLNIHPVVKELNTERLPFEHRMDASFSYTFQPKKPSLPTTYLGLSLYNLYHQRNIYSRTFFIDRAGMEMPRLKYIDRGDMGFTPNLVLRVEW